MRRQQPLLRAANIGDTCTGLGQHLLRGGEVTLVVQFHDVVEGEVAEVVVVVVVGVALVVEVDRRLLAHLLKIIIVLRIILPLLTAHVSWQCRNRALVDLLVPFPIILHLVVAVSHARGAQVPIRANTDTGAAVRNVRF